MSHFCIPPSLLLHLFSYFMCFVCMFMDYMRALPTKARRSCGIPWNWSNQQFVCTMWVMGIEPGSSIRLASALNYWGAFLSELIHITIMLYCLKYLLEKHQKEIWTTFIYMKKYLRGIFEYLLTLEDPVNSTDFNRIEEPGQSRVTNKRAQG